MNHLKKYEVYKDRTDREIHQKLSINTYFMSELLV